MSIKFDRIGTSISLLLIGALGLFLRLPVSAPIMGGQDPGVYANLGNHYARTRSFTISDPIWSALQSQPSLQKYYLRRSFHAIQRSRANTWHGSFTPGIYVSGDSPSNLYPQFLPGQPLLLALGSRLFGPRYASAIQTIFSTCSILLAFLISRSLTRSRSWGLYGALLFAINPALSFFGKYPVSEGFAGFLILIVIWASVSLRSRPALCVIAVLAGATTFFMTRITGFILLPLVQVWFGAEIILTNRHSWRNACRLGLVGIGVAYAGTFFVDLQWSLPYMRSIWKGKLGIPSQLVSWIPLLVLGCTLLSAVIVEWLRQKRDGLRCGLRWLDEKGLMVSVGLVAAIFTAIITRIYLLAWTSYYINHRWFGKRWKIAGDGFAAFHRTSLASLILMLGIPVCIAAVLGYQSHMRRCFKRRDSLLLTILVTAYLPILCGKQLIVPYLYYFGRYLASELVPTLLLFAVPGTRRIWRLVPRFACCRKALVPVVSSCIIAVLPVINASLAHTEHPVGGTFFGDMERFTRDLPQRAVVFIDETSVPEVTLTLPIRLTFGLPTVSVRSSEREIMLAMARHLKTQGYSPVLIAAPFHRFSPREWRMWGSGTISITELKDPHGFELPTNYSTRRIPYAWHEFSEVATKLAIGQ